MRLLPISLIVTLLTSVAVGAPSEKPSNGDKAKEDKVVAAEDFDDESTIFNGVKVPPIPDIFGDSFNETIKDGYWFVKHHSPSCPHCVHIAPTWQTLYEYYYTSKPVPTEKSADSSSTTLNSFTAFYNLHFGSLNCLAFGTACEKNGVGSWPTFVLYKDGKELKRFDGMKTLEGLSEFLEENLEMIRPGSRPVGGPNLPAVKASTSPDFDKGEKKSTTTSEDKEGKSEKGTQEKDAKDGEAKNKEKKPEPLKATRVQDKPAKATKTPKTPNALGQSISLTAESFQDLVTMTQEPWFVKFYAPWCGHCQALAPNWVQLGKEMKGRLNVGEVNCEVEKALCKDVRVRAYPTILFFRGGERVEYEGLRGLGDLISYAEKAIDLGSGVRDVDAVQFQELEEKEDVIFVYFYDHATTTEDFQALERLTLSLIGHAKLVKTNSATLVDRFKITTWPRLLVSRDGRPTYFTALAPYDMRDTHKVLHWMQSVWLPIVPELTASNAREIMDGKLVVLGILTHDRPDDFAQAQKEFKSAALEWMDKETQMFQLERQELRDAKQLRLEEAEDRNDQRAIRAAKSIRINMDRSDRRQVAFAWVDGVFWERWIRTTYGIEVKDGDRVIINDEDNRQYWDTTITGNHITPSRTSILDTIPKVVISPPKIKPKSTIGSFEKFFFHLRGTISRHPWLSIGGIIAIVFGASSFLRRRMRRSRGGFFRLDEKDVLLGSNTNGKVD
ncbi:thioredoxin-like protein [Xylogone sp. PMI_703]|nr:thioredoxin-like protein [Xylogone sp. PMI_703]